MTNIEVQATLKIGMYGLLKFDKTATLKQLHGKIKYIDSNGTIVFKDNESKLFMIVPEKIKSFEAKEMLPPLTHYKGEEVFWTGGRYYYKSTKRECDIKR
jgi:hypothetical protein